MDKKLIWRMAKKYQVGIAKILKDNAFIFVKFRLANETEDMQEATDMVIEVEGGTIALRLRETRFRDFTIRAQTKYGGETEIHKLKKGYGDWYLYAWGDGKDKLEEWILIDLEKLRDSKLLEKEYFTIPNNDGTGFVAISLDELDENNCIVQRKINNI
jgi:hypothetical protein